MPTFVTNLKVSFKITLPWFCKQRPKRPYFLSVTKYFVQLLSRKQNNLGGLKYCNQVCSILSRTMFCIHSLQFMTSPQWKMIIHFHYPKNEVFSPAVFNILKEPFIVQKETLHQQKALDLSYLDLEGQGRGIVRRAPHPHFVKSKFRFSQ